MTEISSRERACAPRREAHAEWDSLEFPPPHSLCRTRCWTRLPDACSPASRPASPRMSRASRMLGRRWRWLRPLALRYLEAFSGGTRPRHRGVTAFLKADAGLAQARAKHGREISVVEWMEEPPRMQPAEAARAWNIPAIETPGALADWLGIEPGKLDWFADLKGLGRKRNQPLLQHYHYRILTKPVRRRSLD